MVVYVRFLVLFYGKSLKIACSRFDDPAGVLVWPGPDRSI